MALIQPGILALVSQRNLNNQDANMQHSFRVTFSNLLSISQNLSVSIGMHMPMKGIDLPPKAIMYNL